jgi:hypothetical protein
LPGFIASGFILVEEKMKKQIKKKPIKKVSKKKPTKKATKKKKA